MAKAFEIEYKYKKVEIHIIDFVGDVRNINGTPDLFSLSYNSNINDKGQYILATEAEINIYEDAYFNIDELKTVGETDILIKYFEHNELVWQGFALPDFFQTGITKPRVLRIVATDRLGVLKDIVNTSVSNTPKEIIQECLLQTGLTLELEVRSVDNYLTSTTIERERIEGVSAYDVIRSFMVQFNSKIVQYKNRWWIVNKKLLEDGFLGQEVIDIDLVYLDGQREIKPTASDVSLFLEFGGSKKYPKNWNFEKWSGSNFLNWTSKNGFIQQKNNKQIVDYTIIGGAGGYYKANYGADTIETSLYIKTDGADGNWFGNYYTKPHIESAPERIPFKDDFVDITISVNFTTASTRALRVLPLIRIINTNPLQHEYFVIQNSGEVTRVGQGEINLDGIQSLRVDDNSDGSNLLEAVQSNWSNTFKVDTSVLGMTRSTNADIRLLIFQPRLNHFSESDVDIFVHSAEFIFNKDEQAHKGLIFKTKQGGDKFSKVRETETTLFSDKINQGVNGYFYNYKYDDTSITNLPKEYLLGMTRQMADMFCSARDFYSLGGKFKVNPLARYRCGNKYFVFVGGVSHRENSEIDIEEIVSNNTLVRTDYIYTYFEDSKDDIKSIGTASGSGGAGGTGGGGGMTSSQLEMLTKLADWWRLDEENDAIYSLKSVYSLKGVSALGLGSGGGGGGGDFDRLDAWVDYNETKANWVLSALLGYDLHTRVNDLEAIGGSSNIDIAITGSGNAVTGVSLSGNTLTFAKSSTFALSTHNHDTLYKPIGYVPSWGEITNKPSTFAPSTHTHTIAQVTGLQTALDNKEPSFTKNTAFNKNFGTVVGTVMQGNDSRVHSHANKPILDQITQSNIDVLAKLSIVDGNIKVDTTLWATGGISALGLGEGGGSGGGGVDMLQSWETYTSDKANFYVPASLLVPFRDDTLSRLASLEVGIGGRNLLIGSTDAWKTVNAYSSQTYIDVPFSETKLEAGQTYVFSWETELLSGSPTAATQVTIGAGVTSYLRDILWTGRPIIGKQFRVFTPTETQLALGNSFMLRWYTNNEVFSFRYRKLKLEKGNNPIADWAPALEDQVSDWSTTNVTSFSYIKNKPTQLSQFIDNIGVATHIANKANPHLVTTAQIGAVDLTTNQSIGGAKTFSSVATIRNILVGNGQGNQIDRTNGTLYIQYDTTTDLSLVNGGGNVGVGTASPLYKLDVAGTGRFTGNVTASAGVNTPKVDFGNGFTIEPSGTELVFKYNGVIKQRMLSDGTILATGGLTALTT